MPQIGVTTSLWVPVGLDACSNLLVWHFLATNILITAFMPEDMRQYGIALSSLCSCTDSDSRLHSRQDVMFQLTIALPLTCCAGDNALLTVSSVKTLLSCQEICLVCRNKAFILGTARQPL